MKRSFSQGFVTKDRTTWRAVINWQDESGKQHRLTKSTGIKCSPAGNRGKINAEGFLREWRDELIAEEAAKDEHVTSCDTPFAKYANEFIEARYRSNVISYVTYSGYRTHIKHLIGTELGNTAISEITPKQIIAWEQDLREDKVSESTLSHIHVFAKQVCIYAYKLGDIARNPFDFVDAPKRHRKPINALDSLSTHQLLQNLEGFGDSAFGTAIKIALMTGMRQGEICALKFSDIDFTNNVIRVSHALKHSKGTYVEGLPKTSSSIRDIPFGSNLKAVLERRRNAVIAECEEIGTGWSDSLYVVGSAMTGKFYNPQVLGHDWYIFVRTIGLIGTQGKPPKFHDLRHAFATRAIASKLDVKTVSSILGHSQCSTTLDIYTDALAESKRAGMEELDKIF